MRLEEKTQGRTKVDEGPRTKCDEDQKDEDIDGRW